MCHVPFAMCLACPGLVSTLSQHPHIDTSTKTSESGPGYGFAPRPPFIPISRIDSLFAPRPSLLVSVCLIQIFNIFYVCCRSLSRISCHLHRHPHEHIDPHLHLHLHIHCHWHWIGNGNCSRKTLATWPATDLTNLPPLRFRVERIRTSHSGASSPGITDRGDPNQIELESNREHMSPYTTFGMS